MATLLLIVIYIAFIGLGIPDSLFGTAWPAIYKEFGMPIAAASYVTLIISGCTIISSLFSAKVVNYLGTAKVTAISTLMTAVALFGFSMAPNMIWLCFMAVPLGLGAGSIDTALNNYVALHYKASHMNFLHCFYGIGVSLSPYLMSLILVGKNNWRYGYRTVSFIQLTIALICFAALPLWKRIPNNSSDENLSEDHIQTVKISQMLKMPAVRFACMAFFGSCAIEYTCGIWGSTFLVNAKSLSIGHAAGAVTFYYVGIATGRFISGLLANKLNSWKLIHMGQFIIFCALIILLLPLPTTIAGIGLFLVGFGNGPMYPNLIHLSPQNFGKNIYQSVMGVQMAASYVGTMLMPPIFGLLAQNITVKLFPVFLLIMYAIMTAALLLLKKKALINK